MPSLFDSLNKFCIIFMHSQVNVYLKLDLNKV